MQVIKPHYKQSENVFSWSQIEKEANEMAKLVDTQGGVYALHHAQVSNEPFNFFVLDDKACADFLPSLGSRFIVNPKILTKMEGTEMALYEGCVSFPFRKQKKVTRSIIIGVEYFIPDFGEKTGLKKMTKKVERIVAQIFQHECEHGEGKNIYFKS